MCELRFQLDTKHSCSRLLPSAVFVFVVVLLNGNNFHQNFCTQNMWQISMEGRVNVHGDCNERVDSAAGTFDHKLLLLERSPTIPATVFFFFFFILSRVSEATGLLHHMAQQQMAGVQWWHVPIQAVTIPTFSAELHPGWKLSKQCATVQLFELLKGKIGEGRSSDRFVDLNYSSVS